MSGDDIILETEDHMRKSMDATKRELQTVRTGKATPAILDAVKVDYYGTPTPLNQVAGVGAPDPRLLTVQPYDKSAMVEIEKAIRAADLGLNPANDGTLIRIPIPQLTEERRRELVKVVSGMIEHGRVAVRNVRHHSNDKLKQLKKDGELTEDEHERHLKKVQDLTNTYVTQLDELLKAKETELMEI